VTYEGQVYNTVLIGDQCWLKENLNVGTMINGNQNMSNDELIEKYCYGDDPSNCDTYGGLYQWNEMMQYVTTEGAQGICPDGWHLPTDEEWKQLEGEVDSLYGYPDPEWDGTGSRGYDAGLNLKSTSGWTNNGNGTNLYGFTLLPGGYRHDNGSFSTIDFSTYIWSSNESNSDDALSRNVWFEDYIARYSSYKKYGFSVRCMKDENQPPEPPSSPNPEDGAINQSIDIDLFWTCTDPDGDPLTYDIYFGTEATPPIVITGQTEITYDPEILENSTEYFWKIVAHDDHSNTTEGPVWSFITVSDALVAYYPFNGNANDESGNGNNGTVYGATLTTDRFWNENSAFSFDGVDDYINTNFEVDYYPQSWSFWVKLNDGNSDWHAILSNDNDAYDLQIAIDNVGEIHIFKGTWGNEPTGINIEFNIWNHIVLIYSLTDIELYVNNVIAWNYGDSPSSSSDGTTLNIGRNPHGWSYTYGKIDDVRIYNSVLTTNNINSLYYEGGWNPISADFTALDTIGTAPLTVQFTDLSTGNPTSWQWDFQNDGTIDSYEQNPDWIYYEPGIYTVSLTVSDGTKATDTETKVDYINVTGQFTRITEGNIVNDGGQSHGSIFGDYDNDGYLDLFVANIGGNNFLYHNNGPDSIGFTKITEGDIVNDGELSGNCSWGDYDNDGYIDLFVSNDENPNFLFHNNGDGSFTKITEGIIVNDVGVGVLSHGCSWGDYDNDGFLDLFVANYGEPNNGQNNFLYHNNRPDSTGFTKITEGDIVNDGDRSVGCCWGDYDNDGFLDLFVANYAGNDLLYHNNGDGSFTKITNSPIVAEDTPSTGGSWGDYDNDGDLDLFVTTHITPHKNYLYQNNGDGTFTKITDGDIVNNTSHSMGGSWGDYNNDGFLDLFVANGSHTYTPNFLYQNNGDGSFTTITTNVVTDAGISRGCIWGDIDNDGDIDLFISNQQNHNNFLYLNNGNNNNWINIKLLGTISNTSGIGAKVKVKALTNKSAPIGWQMQEVSGQTGGMSQNSLNAEFGLGDATVIDSIKIEWPSGIIQIQTNVSVNQFITIEESTSWQCGNPFTDSRDGQTYNSVLIGDQCWMAENLNIGTMINGNEEMIDNSIIEKYCYDDNTSNCDTYGGLYQWNEMMQYVTTPGVQGICPAGWYIPTDDEWKILEGTVDSQYPVGDPIWNNLGWRGYDAGLKLKSTIGWWENGNGTDLFEFTAIPGGWKGLDGYFGSLGYACFFWSSSEFNSFAWKRLLSYNNDKIYRTNHSMDYGYSVRCLKDETPPQEKTVTTEANPPEGGTTIGDGTYLEGTEVTVNAYPNTDWEFINWTVDGIEVSIEAEYTFTITEDVLLVANFEYIFVYYTVTTEAIPPEGGTTTGDSTYLEGSSITVNAYPNTDWVFINWTDEGVEVSTDAEYIFTLTGDILLVANFEYIPLLAPILISATPGIEEVTLLWEAIPEEKTGRFNFEGKSITTLFNIYYVDGILVAGDIAGLTYTDVDLIAGQEYCYYVTQILEGEVESDASNILCATPEAQMYTVTTEANPPESGTTSGDGTYEEGSSVTVNAYPNTDWEFINWTVDGVEVSENPAYTFPVIEDVTLVAHFELIPLEYTVTTEANPPEGGTTAGDGAYLEGTEVTVNASPNTSWEFINWTVEGVEVSDTTEYTFTLTGDILLVANFGPSGFGTISGIVTESETDNPIEGALVVVNETAYSAYTGPEGTYSINVAVDEYSVTASANGYISLTIPEVVVSANETTTVDFSLTLQGTTPHFPFEGGNPADPVWTIYLSTVIFDDLDLQENDEIGVFDGELLVGVYYLSEILTPENWTNQICP
ncbi:MAG: FG-GAP-like repeat-containing protein, partial [Bacteroidales bacterium]|nr:FG-GAP-like repeat-containing protein [Bacteroidales bacterium]